MMDVIPMLAAGSPVAHVVDGVVIRTGSNLPWYISSDGTLWLISNVTVMLVLAGVVTGLLVIPASQADSHGQKRTHHRRLPRSGNSGQLGRIGVRVSA
ncbi:MAG: hypothetical protein HC898_11935 [Phycisphaerales bacterium]|nr:hypothetical protein [Phycisphaerales bacterium]